MYKSIYHLGHIPASNLNNLKGTETLLFLYIMGTVINLLWIMKMANSVIKFGVMRFNHGMELIKLNALDLLKESDHQLEAYHLLITK